MAKRKTFYVPAAIFEGDRSAYAVAVYAYLCFCADRSGTCFPGMETIARCLGLSRNTVKKAMNELERCGLVRSETTRQRSKNGRMRQGANRYLLGSIASHGAGDPSHGTASPLSPYAGDPPHGMTPPPSPYAGDPHHETTPPPSRDEGEINNNSKVIMGDVPSVGITAREEDTTGPDAILKPLYLDTFYDQVFAQSVKQAIEAMYGLAFLSLNGTRVPNALIRKRLKLLTIDHIDYVEKQLGERGTEVTNGEKYLMACLYNAPVDCMVHAARDRNA